MASGNSGNSKNTRLIIAAVAIFAVAVGIFLWNSFATPKPGDVIFHDDAGASGVAAAEDGDDGFEIEELDIPEEQRSRGGFQLIGEEYDPD